MKKLQGSSERAKMSEGALQDHLGLALGTPGIYPLIITFSLLYFCSINQNDYTTHNMDCQLSI
jgi:hypothetical protein